MPGDHVQNHLRSPNPMHLCSSELGEDLLSTLPFFDDSNRRGKGRLRMRFKLNHHLLWLYREIKRAKLNPRVNSIVISRMNTLDLVGECGYVEENYPYLFLPDRLWMTRFKRKSKINVKWLSYLLSYTKYKAKIKEAATGTSGSMKNISKGSLLSINIPFPASEEQRAIANILSDMDAEIAALEQKRDKIRALNQGMMQELLTGKTRLL